MMKRLVWILAVLLPGTALAHQPVMDMAPRWSGGSGFQVRYESITSSDLLADGSRLDNPLGLRSTQRTTWYEGVYTFHRSFRVTFKLPSHLLSKRALKSGQAADLEASGLGDLILTTPIKHYVNYVDHTWNLGVNPSVTLPTGKTSGEIPLGRGTVDYGLSVSYARESPLTFGFWDLFGKIHTEGADGKKKGDLLGLDMNVGVIPYANSGADIATLLLWGTHVRHAAKDQSASGGLDGDSGGFSVEIAPIFVFLYENYAVRVEAYFPAYRKLNGTQLVNDYTFQVGVGMTFPSWNAI